MEEGSPTFPLPITWVMQIRCPLLFTLIHTHTYTVEHLSVEREIQPAWIWRQRGESRHPSFIIIPIFSLSLLNWLPKHTKCIFKIIYEFSRGQRRAVDQHDVSRALLPSLYRDRLFLDHKTQTGEIMQRAGRKTGISAPECSSSSSFFFPVLAIRAVHVGENSFTLVSVTKLSRSKIIRSPFLQAALVMISIEAIASSSPRSGTINSISRRFIIMQQRGIKQNNQKFSFRSLSLSPSLQGRLLFLFKLPGGSVVVVFVVPARHLDLTGPSLIAQEMGNPIPSCSTWNYTKIFSVVLTFPYLAASFSFSLATFVASI